MIKDETGDAFDVLVQQDHLVCELMKGWRDATWQLEDHDDVAVRSERGSDVKLLLQHLAVREAAIEQVEGMLREQDEPMLADQLEGNGIHRREEIGHLDHLTRGRQAMATNVPEVSLAVKDIGALLDTELEDRDVLMAEVAAALGPPEARQLASARYVRTHSPTVPSPTPRWYDRVGALKAARALYDHLRGSPSRGTRPSVDEAREHTPGLRD